MKRAGQNKLKNASRVIGIARPVTRSYRGAFVFPITMSRTVKTFDLASGVKIPWLGWGNGSGQARNVPVQAGLIALQAGIRHIDTAQNYLNEGAVGETVANSGLLKDEIFVTSKRMLYICDMICDHDFIDALLFNCQCRDGSLILLSMDTQFLSMKFAQPSRNLSRNWDSSQICS